MVVYLQLKQHRRKLLQLHARALLRSVCFTCIHWLVRALFFVPRIVCAAFAEYDDTYMTLIVVAGASIFCSLSTRRRPVSVFTHIVKVVAVACCMWLPFTEGAQFWMAIMVVAVLVAWRCQRASSLVLLIVGSSRSSVDTPAKQSGRQPDTDDRCAV
jgi:uncharacterized membrane protein